MPTSLPIKGEADKKIGAYNAPLSVTAQDTPNMTVKVRAGSFFNSANTLTEFIGGNSPQIVPPLTAAKWVIVGVTDTGSVTLVHGTNQVSPSLPAIPSGVLALAAVYVTSTTTSLTPALIQDIRPFLRTVDTVPDIASALAERPTFTDLSNDLVLKADVDGTPNSLFMLNKGSVNNADTYLSVSRNNAAPVSIRWNTAIAQWEFTNDGINYGQFASTNGTYAPLIHHHVATDVTDFGPVVDELIGLATIQPTQVEGLGAALDSKASEDAFASHAADFSIHHTLPLSMDAVADLPQQLYNKADLSGATFLGNVTVHSVGNQPITLASDDSGSSGLQVARGAQDPTAKLEWDESSKAWLVGVEGAMNTILTGNLSSGVAEVNGKTGNVVLAASDVGAADKVHQHAIADVDGLTDALAAKVSQTKTTVTTTDATSTPLMVFDIPVGDVVAYNIMVTGFREATGDAFAARIFAALKDIGGVVQMIGNPQYSTTSDTGAAAWTVDFDVATSAALMVKGDVGPSIVWNISMQSV